MKKTLIEYHLSDKISEMRIYRYLFMLLFTLLLHTPTWAGDYKGVAVIKSNTLQEIDGELHLSLEIAINGAVAPDFGAISFTPKLVTDSHTERFGTIMIQGDNKRKTYSRWQRTMGKEREHYKEPVELVRVSKERDTTLYYLQRLPYMEWMDDAILAVEQELITYRDERSLLIFALDGRIQFESFTPYEPSPKVYFVEPEAEHKIRTRSGKAHLDFKLGRSNIVPSYGKNPSELRTIDKMFDEIINSADATIMALYIEGYASPEGSYYVNERLARERAVAFKEYILNNFRISIPSNQVVVSSVAEDWDGLRSEVNKSNLANKGEVLSIIDNTPDISQRKGRLQLLAGGSIYRVMLQEIYPQLRRAEYHVEFTVKDYSVEEAKNLIDKSRDLLSHKELYSLAMYYGEGSEEFEQIMLDIAPSQFPDDEIAAINASAQMIRRGEFLRAKQTLNEHKDNPASYNNLGVLSLLEGNLVEAERLFVLAQKEGVKVAEENLKEVDKKREDNRRKERYMR